MHADFTPFAERMQAEGLHEIAIRTFEFYYNQLAAGQTGLIPERDIRSVEPLPDLERLSVKLAEAGHAALSRAIILKLNGGLGTSMGLEKAKSILVVKNRLSFLDIIARQANHAGVPLVLMSSFATRDDSLAVLMKYPKLMKGIPLDFLQHKVPKVLLSDLSPASWPTAPELEWCPPGHGDIYIALITSGMLETLIAHGYRYAFVANADNLGAVLDPLVLGYFVTNELPFLMEVADRTSVDRKGGHLARSVDGRLVLRELAQCPIEDVGLFQDINRYRYFNTNNIWLDLVAFKGLWEARKGALELPMIRNEKSLDPRDLNSPKVYQLETAMGAAIALFENAGALRVPRTRFAPVKTTTDLLVTRSDAYILTDDFRLVLNPSRGEKPLLIQLDSAYYGRIDDFEARFPFGAPSLVECLRLRVEGDVRFERDVVLAGNVHLVSRTTKQLVLSDCRIAGG